MPKKESKPTKEEIEVKKEKLFKNVAAQCITEEKESIVLEQNILNNYHLKHENGDLFLAVENSDVQAVKEMIRNGSFVDETDDYGCTPLIYACQSGKFKIAVVLIENKANINQKTKHGFTPLMFAAWNGFKNITALLIHHGADVNVTNLNGDVALHFAALSGNILICLMLRKAGAKKDIKNKNKKTPLDHMKSFVEEFDVAMSLPAVEKKEIKFERSHHFFSSHKVASEYQKYIENTT